MSYGVSDFGSMLIDEPRLDAYLGALSSIGVEGKRVLDLGCGTGFFTLRALADGASEVVGVELLDAVDLLPDVLRANGLADRAQIYKGDIRELDLGRFDLVISDLRGMSPFYEEHLDVLAWVHENALTDGADLIPSIDTLRVAPVAVPDWFERVWKPWLRDEHDWSVYSRTAVVRPHRMSELQASAVLAPGQTWGTINYRDRDSLTARRWDSNLTFEVQKSGPLHGIATWFDAEIAPGHCFSTEPADRQPTYGRQLLPFATPIDVAAGQTVQCEISCRRVRSQWVWSWAVETQAERLEHSTLDSLPLSAESLDRVRSGSDVVETGRLL